VEPEQPAAVDSGSYRRYLLPGILLLSGWWLLYRSLPPFSRWMTYDVFSLTRGSGFASAVEFFIYDTPKVLLLLTLVVTDMQVIMGFGVMMTPALAVDGVVKLSGKVPSAEELKKILSV
jgi:hypothetical protein